MEVVRQLGVPLGAVNLSGVGDRGVYRFREAQGIPILMGIPFDPHVTMALVAGLPVVEHASESPASNAIKKIWNVVKLRPGLD